VTAGPASALAHAVVHDRDAHEAHRYVAPLDAHDGPAELSTRGDPASHQHTRLDQAARTPTHHLLIGPPVTATAPDLDVGPSKRVGDVPPSSIPAPDPPGDDPPRLRAPPLH